jgi:hypothetical protein
MEDTDLAKNFRKALPALEPVLLRLSYRLPGLFKKSIGFFRKTGNGLFGSISIGSVILISL